MSALSRKVHKCRWMKDKARISLEALETKIIEFANI